MSFDKIFVAKINTGIGQNVHKDLVIISEIYLYSYFCPKG